jgi:4a-hydroxytetrahydrobiopterin dehydratase
MTRLAERECVPCKGGVPPLDAKRQSELLRELRDGWLIDASGHLRCEFKFKDFASALDYVNTVGATAEQVKHHPDLHLSYGRVIAEIWTHKINGLTESDFVFAAKMDEAYHALTA